MGPKAWAHFLGKIIEKFVCMGSYILDSFGTLKVVICGYFANKH